MIVVEVKMIKVKEVLKTVYPYIFNDSDNCMNELYFDNYDYESSIEYNQKKNLGQFYTKSNDVMNYMISKVSFAGSMLEPSCGCGSFVLSYIREKTKTLIKEKSSAEVLIDIFTSVTAVDIDATACKKVEINVLLECYDLIQSAYESDPSFILPRLNVIEMDFCDFNEAGTYDLVIGNPPYVTFYGKRSRDMNETKRAKFNTFDFVQKKNGNNKFNMVMFFLENGIKALKKNGTLIFIIDIAFFETAYIDIRRYILSNCYIKSITTNLTEFENVASGQVILELVKTDEVKMTSWVDFKTKNTINIDQKVWNDPKNNYKIFIPLNNKNKDINEKLDSYKSLDYYFPNKSLRTCCALTGRTEDFIVKENKITNNTIFPYLEGSKGINSKFGVPTAERFIEFDYNLQIQISDEFKIELEKLGVKNKKRVTLGDDKVYLSPKIFIRQSAKEIIATYTEKPFAANNSIYVLSLKSNDEKDIKMLKYTCGILNSDLVTYYCLLHNIIRCGDGKTPQIKLSDLKRVKLNVDQERFEDIINIVEKLSATLSQESRELYIKQLNSIVYDIYKITEEEIIHIEDYIKDKC